MKVNFELSGKVGFFIEPETDFEAELIAKIFKLKNGVDGYVRCGLTPAEVQGLRVYSAWWDCTSSAKEENKSNTQQLKDSISLKNEVFEWLGFSRDYMRPEDVKSLQKILKHSETEIR